MAAQCARSALQAGRCARSALQAAQCARSALQAGRCARSALQAGRCARSALQAGRCARSALQAGRCARSVLQAGRCARSALQAGRCACSALQAGQCACSALQAGRYARSALQAARCARSALQAAQCARSALQAGRCARSALQAAQCARSALHVAQCARSALQARRVASFLIPALFCRFPALYEERMTVAPPPASQPITDGHVAGQVGNGAARREARGETMTRRHHLLYSPLLTSSVPPYSSPLVLSSHLPCPPYSPPKRACFVPSLCPPPLTSLIPPRLLFPPPITASLTLHPPTPEVAEHSSLLPCAHLCSPALTSAPLRSPLLPCAHLCSPALTSAPLRSPLLPCTHLCSPALTSAPLHSPLLPCTHLYCSPTFHTTVSPSPTVHAIVSPSPNVHTTVSPSPVVHTTVFSPLFTHLLFPLFPLFTPLPSPLARHAPRTHLLCSLPSPHSLIARNIQPEVAEHSSLLPCAHLCSPALTSAPLRSPLLPCAHLCSPALTSAPLRSPLLPCAHLCSPALISAPLRSPLLPCGHLCSPALTSAPLRSPLLPCAHLCSPALTSAPLRSPLLPCTHLCSPALTSAPLHSPLLPCTHLYCSPTFHTTVSPSPTVHAIVSPSPTVHAIVSPSRNVHTTVSPSPVVHTTVFSPLFTHLLFPLFPLFTPLPSPLARHAPRTHLLCSLPPLTHCPKQPARGREAREIASTLTTSAPHTHHPPPLITTLHLPPPPLPFIHLSPLLPSTHLCSPALTSAPLRSPLLPCAHLCSPALTSAPLRSPLLPCTHLCSPALTSAPLHSPLLPCTHLYCSPTFHTTVSPSPTVHAIVSPSPTVHAIVSPQPGEKLPLLTRGISPPPPLPCRPSSTCFHSLHVWEREVEHVSGGELQRFAIGVVGVQLGDRHLHVWEREVEHLSGGELQRFAIGVVAGQLGDIYMFDEPSSYLDVRQRLKAAQVIRSLLRPDRYVIVVEHDLSVLDYLSDFICCLYGKPGAYGVVTLPFSVREGINIFLAGFVPTENLRFRDESLTFRVAETPVDNPEEAKTYTRYKYPRMVKKQGGFKLTVEPGDFTDSQIVVMLGENGTGKTTFIRMLAGLLKADPDEETGKEAEDLPEFNVSYKPQKISPKFPHSVRALLHSKIRDSFHHPQFNTDVLRPMQIDPLLDQEVVNLSGGELQRVAITLCLGKPADIYLIDEPSAYLDSEQRIVAAKVIKRFILHAKKTAFVVEHDFIMATYLADRVIVYEGQPSVDCTARTPQSLNSGMNLFLSQLDITFRRDPTNFRPRINKMDSVKDREQKNAGTYYYLDD
ncbi:unnamed protein product [Closterium sp. NIES-65]|nr:unnamed protein product [Closterium sp. NIES-65]